ncbi:MAG: hypothetical protein L0Y75_08820 [Acidobacteria bacterium]|nr:hypothetical protein [Acidobacteriota bacterium]
MELTLKLTPDIADSLIEYSQRQGTTPELLVLETLRKLLAPPVTAAPADNQYQTLADFLDGYVGVVDSGELVPGGARMSEECGEKFAAGMLEKRERGKL